MDRKNRVNWLALTIGFGLTAVLLAWLLPSTRWIVVKSVGLARNEEELWSVKPSRIKGSGEAADLARALQQTPSNARIESLQEFHAAYPKNVEGLAHLCRTTLIQSSPNQATAFSFQAIADLAREGANLEPENLFWPLVIATVETELGNEAAARLAIAGARRCTVFRDYAIHEPEAVSSQAGSLTKFEGVYLYASVVLPHFAHFRKATDRLVKTDDDARIDIALASVTMTRSAETAITHLVAQRMAKVALVPSLDSNHKPSESEFAMAAAQLAAIRPEAKSEIDLAVRLAVRSAPHIYDDRDQFLFDQAAEGSALRLFMGATAWLVLTIALIPVVAVLSRFARKNWVAVVAPLIGFGVLAWLAWFPAGDVTMNEARWTYHLAETTTIAIIIGFLAVFDRLTVVVRWVLFALSLLTLPMAWAIPVLFVPVAVIWLSLLLVTRFGERFRNDWPLGLLPALLALPVAFQLVEQNFAAMALWCIGAIVLAFSIGKESPRRNVYNRALAVSVGLPALAVVAAIWWNLKTDSRLEGIFDGDQQVVTELRDAVVP